MNLTEISEKYPVSCEKMIGMLLGESKSPVTDAAKKIAVSFLAPRALFDFFDKNEIFITTIYVPDDSMWRVVIDNNDVDESPLYVSKGHTDRRKAEEDGVLNAFQLLEDGFTSR